MKIIIYCLRVQWHTIKEAPQALEGRDCQNILLHRTNTTRFKTSRAIICLKKGVGEWGREENTYLCIDCHEKDSQAGDTVFFREAVRPVGVRLVSADLCCLPAQPKLSSLKQPPFSPPHLSVGWLHWQGLLHMVSQSPQKQGASPVHKNFQDLYLHDACWVPLAKAIHMTKSKLKVEK